ncbi:MAG: hypothetical protein ISN28_11965 [Ectothiorhodospiraceae bacterium AqS1]|nr:hypothetical protein [Ectothiorhodospiraceae bacterium AqS1]
MRFIDDAISDHYDAEILDIDINKCFDASSVRWYKERFASVNPHRHDAKDDNDFLYNRGFLVERDGRLLPTRAAILVLGSDRYARQALSRAVVDLQFYYHKVEEYSSITRWADRLVVEENLIEAWHAMLAFYFRHSERPFSIDPTTLARNDYPPDYISFREAAINLLIHQDFSYPNRMPVIRLFRDRMEFSNPGDAFVSQEGLLESGGKDIRNPNIVDAFRRIGLAGKGGTGIGAIFENWRALGFIPPKIDNNKRERVFRIRLYRETLVDQPDGGADDRDKKRKTTVDSAWDFVEIHLGNLSIIESRNNDLEFNIERDPVRLFDRMVAWFILHDVPVPLSEDEFLTGLQNRFPQRDGMVFLPEQVVEYDKRRGASGKAAADITPGSG